MPYYPEKKTDIPEEIKQQAKATDHRRKLLRLSLAVVSCLLIGYGGKCLIQYYSDLAASRQTGAELLQISRLVNPGTDSPLPEKEETVVSPSPAPSPDAQEFQLKARRYHRI